MSLNHTHMGGGGGYTVSRNRSTAPCTQFDKLKQTEGHRADPDTKHPRQNQGVLPPHSNPNYQHAFSPTGALGEDQRAHLRGSRRKVLPQFVILDRNPRKQTGWELSLKWGEAT